VKLDGKDYTFRILDALEWDNLVDLGGSQNTVNRRLVSACTGIPEDDLPKDRPTYARLVFETHNVNGPKGLTGISEKSSPSPKP
jgi:hypothetical protein